MHLLNSGLPARFLKQKASQHEAPSILSLQSKCEIIIITQLFYPSCTSSPAKSPLGGPHLWREDPYQARGVWQRLLAAQTQ